MRTKRQILSFMVAVLAAATMLPTMTSCDDNFFEDLEECPRGVNLRFVYDYNMLYANAFMSQVDCLTLYIYDSEGNFVESRTETTDVLADENYRMTIDLPEGNYHLVAYGGLACEKTSFSLITPQTRTTLSSLQVKLNHSGYTSARRLHDLFFGSLDVTVVGDMYRDYTVHMMKDTNNIRIVLQQLNGKEVSDKDFTISIMDDNTMLSCSNNILPDRTISYFPWTQGQAVAGTMPNYEGREQDGIVAYAELSTSRLWGGNKPRLVIKNNDTGDDVVNIPLIQYLLLLKSELYSEMGSQEFLDREYNWSMVFFLDTKHEWVRTHIVINDWVVRLNDVNI